MDEKEKGLYDVNFAEASKITIEYMTQKMKNGDELDENKAVAVALAGSDALAKLLVYAVVNPWLKCKYPVPCFMIFPAAFKIAEKAWEKLMEQGAPDGFLQDAIPAIEQIVKWSEEEGLLFNADEIGREIEKMRGAKNEE